MRLQPRFHTVPPDIHVLHQRRKFPDIVCSSPSMCLRSLFLVDLSLGVHVRAPTLPASLCSSQDVNDTISMSVPCYPESPDALLPQRADRLPNVWSFFFCLFVCLVGGFFVCQCTFLSIHVFVFMSCFSQVHVHYASVVQ